jgi:carbonic anhydrase
MEPKDLLANNRAWAGSIRRRDPGFFERSARGQSPEFLWIGCSDSREPESPILDVAPGNVFVHRNIANLVLHSDLNCLAVLEFAVVTLRVRHIIVAGHYGCGGVGAVLDRARHGLMDNWLAYVGETLERHRAAIDALPEAQRHHRLCELNVIEQVANACRTPSVRDAWERGQPLTVHG